MVITGRGGERKGVLRRNRVHLYSHKHRLLLHALHDQRTALLQIERAAPWSLSLQLINGASSVSALTLHQMFRRTRTASRHPSWPAFLQSSPLDPPTAAHVNDVCEVLQQVVAATMP